MLAMLFTLLAVLGADGEATVMVSITSDDPARLQGPVSVTLTDGTNVRKWSTKGKRVTPFELHVTPGEYTLTVAAARHQETAKKFVAAKGPAKKVNVVLAAHPVLSGTVVRAESGEPIIGATVRARPRELLTSSDAVGKFELDVRADEWPQWLEVSAPGLGTAIVRVAPVHTSQALPVIRLSPAATIRVGAIAGERRTLELAQRDENGMPQALRTVNVAADGPTLLTEIAPGDYWLTLKGSEPMQRYGVPIKALEAGETRDITFPLEPRRLRLATKHGERVLPDASVHLLSWDGLWQATVTTDSKGNLEGEIWQTGKFSTMVKASPLASPYMGRGSIEGADPIDHTIRVPERVITGTLTDEADGAPIGKGRVGLTLSGANATMVETKEDGTFTFSGIEPGVYIFVASADGYLPKSRAGWLKIGDTDPAQQLSITLRRASSQKIIAVDARNQPIAGATVIDAYRTVVTGERFTNANGEVDVVLPPGQQRTVFVLSPTGSFGVGTIGGDKRAGEVRVVVPAAVGGIDIRTQDREKKAVAGVTLLVRYNGELVPLRVLEVMAQRQGNAFISGADGGAAWRFLPAGTYELWAVGSPEQVREIETNRAAKAAAVIPLQAGLHAATITVDVAR